MGQLGLSISMFDSKQRGATYGVGVAVCSQMLFSNKWPYVLCDLFATKTAFSESAK